jgi:NAD(P)-dependent dehydrogenase (short-subunit alcohol dehydrogenase family)
MDGGTVPKAALVTGAARRLGRAMALALAEDGWDVAIHCNGSPDEALEVRAGIERLGRRATVVRADLALEAEAGRVAGEAVAALGPLGLLVNNASVFALDHLATADRPSWDRHMEINLRAPVVLAQGFVAALPEGAEGVIVNLLDQRVLNLTPNFLSYSISKAGLWAATQVLARQLAPRVRVNAIGPGPALKPAEVGDADWRALCDSVPLRRGGGPDEIVAALRFILAARSMTGQLLTLDGGMQMGWLTPGIRELD